VMRPRPSGSPDMPPACSATSCASPGARGAGAMTAEPRARRLLAYARPVTTTLALVGVWVFLLSYFTPSLLLLDTTSGGGDTPGFLPPIEHLRDVLLPAGTPHAWAPGNFAGSAP